MAFLKASASLATMGLGIPLGPMTPKWLRATTSYPIL